MKEIVVISGKGGTGKTSITAALAYLNKEKTVVADCDVDAADMHLLLKPDFANPAKFYSGHTAVIDQNNCIKCNKCRQVCAFGAINYSFLLLIILVHFSVSSKILFLFRF